MSLGHSVHHNYCMSMTDQSGTHIMSRTMEEKDLGIFITDSDTLKPSVQCTKAAARARSILAMVRRNFKRLDCEIKHISNLILNMLSSRGLHRPTSRRIYSVWKVQRAATRLISGFKELSYEQRLRSTALTTLEVRRQRGDLIECYKILAGKENIDSHQFFEELPSLR